MYYDPHQSIEDNVENVQHPMLVESLWEWLSVNTETPWVCRECPYVQSRQVKLYKINSSKCTLLHIFRGNCFIVLDKDDTRS